MCMDVTAVAVHLMIKITDAQIIQLWKDTTAKAHNSEFAHLVGHTSEADAFCMACAEIHNALIHALIDIGAYNPK